MAGSSEISFELIYQRWYLSVYRACCSRLGEGFDADDATQEIFLRVYRIVSSGRSISRFSRWLSQATQTVVYDIENTSKIEQEKFDLVAAEKFEWFMEDQENPEHLYERQEAIRLLELAVEQLPLSQRLTLNSHYGRDLSASEIAFIKTENSNAVRKRLFDARETLHKKLKHDIDITHIL